jgi:hypothetical protein
MSHRFFAQRKVLYSDCRTGNPGRSGSLGFTLVELIAALTLATLLIVAVLWLAGRLSHHRRILEQAAPFEGWKSRLTRQVEMDFQNSRSILVRPKELVFTGFSYRQRGSAESRHLPTQIAYTIVAEGSRSFLVRREVHSDESPGANTQSTIMCDGVTRIDSRTRLDTDVPPGVVNLVWTVTTDTRTTTFPMVLVRHGVSE